MLNKDNINQKEEYAYILDIVQDQKNFNDNEILQAVGSNNFVLLELGPKERKNVKVGEKVYIGDKKRDKIQFIKQAIHYKQLSNSAQDELLYILIDIVKEREKEFVYFLNKAGPITIRRHALEIIPGLGKKSLSEILEKRRIEPFLSFEDAEKRCTYFSDIPKIFATRIVAEMKDKTDKAFFYKKLN